MPQGLYSFKCRNFWNSYLLSFTCGSCLLHPDDAKSYPLVTICVKGGFFVCLWIFCLFVYCLFPIHLFLLFPHVHTMAILSIYTILSSPRHAGQFPRLETKICSDLPENFSSFSVAVATSQTYSVMLEKILHRSYPRHLCFCQVPDLIHMPWYIGL